MGVTLSTLKNPSLIVGIDPGTTIGLAFLDLDGGLVLLRSGKNMGVSEISRAIAGTGSPIIISTDVNPPPRVIEKASSAFSARLVYPKRSLGRREKNSITRGYCKKILHARKPPWANRHEKDALASAVFAWKAVRPTLKKIRDKLNKHGIPPGKIEELIRLNALSGGKSITRSIRELLDNQPGKI